MLRYLRLKAYFALLLASTTVQASSSTPVNQALYDQYRWSVLYYYGRTVSNPLIEVIEGRWKAWPEHLQSLELMYTLSPDNVVRRFFSPVVGVVQIAAIGAVRYGKGENTIYEVDPYFLIRWANLPWNHIVTTSFAIGEGISYDTSIPSIEKRDNDNTRRLLNYLMLEATLAPPANPRWQFVARIHHRSGAYGLYHAGNTGSNVVGAGIRYLFD